MAGVLLYGGSFDPIHHGHLIVSRAVAEQLGVARVLLIPSATPPHKQRQALAPAADRLAMCRLAVADDPQFEVSDWELTQPGPSYTLHTVRHFARALGGNVGTWERGNGADAETNFPPCALGQTESSDRHESPDVNLNPDVSKTSAAFRSHVPTFPRSHLYWLLGMDSLIDLPTWHRVSELANACTLVTALRPGFSRPDLSHLSPLLSAAQIETIARHILPSPLIDIRATDVRARVRAGRSIRYLVPDPVRAYIEQRRLYAGEGA